MASRPAMTEYTARVPGPGSVLEAVFGGVPALGS